MMTTPGRAYLLLPLALFALGCPERPRAPRLVNEAVYQNDKIGLRFLVPEGWLVTARTDLPSGRLTRPIILVMYQENHGLKPADFELMAADLTEDVDLGQYLVEHQIGAAKWTLDPIPDVLTLNGATATRYLMTRGKGKEEVRREATAFRRGERVFFLIVTFGSADTDRRDQVRKSVESITWTN